MGTILGSAHENRRMNRKKVQVAPGQTSTDGHAAPRLVLGTRPEIWAAGQELGTRQGPPLLPSQLVAGRHRPTLESPETAPTPREHTGCTLQRRVPGAAGSRTLSSDPAGEKSWAPHLSPPEQHAVSSRLGRYSESNDPAVDLSGHLTRPWTGTGGAEETLPGGRGQGINMLPRRPLSASVGQAARCKKDNLEEVQRREHTVLRGWFRGLI